MIEVFFATLPFVVCTTWCTIILLDYMVERTPVRLRLLAFMFACSLLYLCHLVFFSKLLRIIPLSDVIYGACNLAVYPLYLIYIWQLTDGGIRRRQWFILLPSAVIAVVYAVLYWVMTPEEAQLFVTHYLYHGRMRGLTGLPEAMAWAHTASNVLFILLVGITLWYGTRHLKAFSNEVKSIYADIEGRTLSPIRFFLFAFMVTSLFSILFSFLGRYRFEDHSGLVAVPALLFSALLFAVGYTSTRVKFSYANLVEEQLEGRETEEKDCSEPASPEEEATKLADLAKEIEQLMEEKRMYLHYDLRVKDVAQELGTNSKYVSQAVNTQLGMSFSDYINNQRITYALKLKQDHPEMSSSEIANQSGYLSMQSYYRNLRLRKAGERT